jgi:hypothetical protein
MLSVFGRSNQRDDTVTAGAGLDVQRDVERPRYAVTLQVCAYFKTLYPHSDGISLRLEVQVTGINAAHTDSFRFTSYATQVTCNLPNRLFGIIIIIS